MDGDGRTVAGKRLHPFLAVAPYPPVQISGGFEERRICAGLTKLFAYEHPFISRRPHIAGAGAAIVANPRLCVPASAGGVSRTQGQIRQRPVGRNSRGAIAEIESHYLSRQTIRIL